MPRPLIPQRRARITEAARELIVDKGWRTTTVADIAERAGIGKGALYLEFGDKTQVLDAVLRAGTRQLTATVHAQVVATTETVDLAAVYRFAVDALLEDPVMCALHLGDDALLGEHVRAVDNSRYAERFAWLTDYTVQLQQAGVIASEMDAATITRMLSIFTIGLLNSPGTLGDLDHAHLRSAVDLFAKTVSRGLAPTDAVQTDAGQARRAQLELLTRLDDQLDRLDDQQ